MRTETSHQQDHLHAQAGGRLLIKGGLRSVLIVFVRFSQDPDCAGLGSTGGCHGDARQPGPGGGVRES